MPDKNGPYKPGTPCWIDLMVPDQQAALDFYCDLFGWQGEVGPPEQGGYSVCTLKGKPVMRRHEGDEPGRHRPGPDAADRMDHVPGHRLHRLHPQGGHRHAAAR